MHVLVARPRFIRTLDEDEARRALSEAVTLYETSGGFHAFYSVRVSDREVINISFWDSREDAERGFAAARPAMSELLGPIMDGPPARISGELTFSYRVGEGTTAD
jgi:heme-degrading monooxygenase HmoA